MKKYSHKISWRISGDNNTYEKMIDQSEIPKMINFITSNENYESFQVESMWKNGFLTENDLFS